MDLEIFLIIKCYVRDYHLFIPEDCYYHQNSRFGYQLHRLNFKQANFPSVYGWSYNPFVIFMTNIYYDKQITVKNKYKSLIRKITMVKQTLKEQAVTTNEVNSQQTEETVVKRAREEHN